MNKKIFMTALCFMAVVSQDAGAVRWASSVLKAPYIAAGLQATAAVDSDNAKFYDVAFIFAPLAADAMSRILPSSTLTGLTVGVNAACCLRALYLHKDFFTKKFTKERINKLAGTVISLMFAFSVYREFAFIGHYRGFYHDRMDRINGEIKQLSDRLDTLSRRLGQQQQQQLDEASSSDDEK